MAIITVLGAGMMGSALCVPLVDAGHEVRLVGTHLDGEIIDSLKKDSTHPKLRLELPRAIRPYPIDELDRAMQGVDIIGVGVSSPGVRWARDKLAPFARPGIPIAMITKGLEWNGTRLEVLPDVLAPPGTAPTAIAGPCIAGELARRVETCVVVTGRDSAMVDRVVAAFETPYYHLFPSLDVVGVEGSAALKNAYAMGIAFATGQHEARGGQPGSVAMHNAESAVFAQAVVEMQRIVSQAGGDPASATWLPGVGDLDVTTNGGRTGRFGKFLGLGLSRDEAVARMEGATLECLDILAVLEAALPSLEPNPDALPLLRHMIAVALKGEPVNIPFKRFFR
jgi:glycerol-3-phosphate dehydrogenase (NAD(P)+)